MRLLKILCAAVLLAIPVAALADARDVPGSAEWYLHIDLEKMRSEDAGQAVYDWFRDEALDEVRDEAGIDIDKEVSRLTAFSVAGQGPVVVVEEGGLAIGDLVLESDPCLARHILCRGELLPMRQNRVLHPIQIARIVNVTHEVDIFGFNFNREAKWCC